MNRTRSTPPQVSLVVTLQREGSLCRPALRSLDAACRYAAARQVITEIVLVLDRPDPTTRALAMEAAAPGGYLNREGLVRLVEVDHGDPAGSRNHGLGLVRAPVAGVMDATHLISANWVVAGLDLLQRHPRSVVHPELLFAFGEEQAICRPPSSDEPDFRPDVLYSTNYWPALAMSDTEVYRAHPYGGPRPAGEPDPEDWHWNLRTWFAGIPHRRVAETALFYRVRRRHGSHNRDRLNLLPAVEMLTDPELASRAVRQWQQEHAADSCPAQLGQRQPAGLGTLHDFRAVDHSAPELSDVQAAAGPLGIGLSGGCPPRPPPDPGRPDSTPEWLLAAWTSQRRLEPALPDPAQVVPEDCRWHPNDYRLSDFPEAVVWWQLVRHLLPRLGRLVIAPSDSASRSYLATLIDRLHADARHSVALMITAGEFQPPSTWPAEVGVIALDLITGWTSLGVTERLRLLGNLGVQFRPEQIHVLGDPIGVGLLERHGRALARSAPTMLHLPEVPRPGDPDPLAGHGEWLRELSGVGIGQEGIRERYWDLYRIPRETFTPVDALTEPPARADSRPRPTGPFIGNYFCLMPGTGLAFVTVSKNAVTHLKRVAVWLATGHWPQTFAETHDTIGYDHTSPYLVHVDEMPEYERAHGRRFKFAVWRDPVRRLESTFSMFCLDLRHPQPYFQMLDLQRSDITFERFFQFCELEWTKPDPQFQDEHLRRQADYYTTADVDAIITAEQLTDFLAAHGIWAPENSSNATTAPFRITSPEQLNRIREHYRADYDLDPTGAARAKAWAPPPEGDRVD